MELLHATRWEKRNGPDFYWEILLKYAVWEYWSLCDTFYGSKTFMNSSNFFSDFGIFLPKYILENI